MNGLTTIRFSSGARVRRLPATHAGASELERLRPIVNRVPDGRCTTKQSASASFCGFTVPDAEVGEIPGLGFYTGVSDGRVSARHFFSRNTNWARAL